MRGTYAWVGFFKEAGRIYRCKHVCINNSDTLTNTTGKGMRAITRLCLKCFRHHCRLHGTEDMKKFTFAELNPAAPYLHVK